MPAGLHVPLFPEGEDHLTEHAFPERFYQDFRPVREQESGDPLSEREFEQLSLDPLFRHPAVEWIRFSIHLNGTFLIPFEGEPAPYAETTGGSCFRGFQYLFETDLVF